METLLVIGLLVLIAIGFTWYQRSRRLRVYPEPGPVVIPPKWRELLEAKVHFYRNLSPAQRVQFESDVFHFLNEVRITGAQTEVTLQDRLLVASSAVIPLFGFPTWRYQHLDEVLLYPAAFDRNFKLNNPQEIITGMVGNGPMEGKMILSQPALRVGFDITNDKKNVGIHEFIHLFDKETGAIDGIPPGYEDHAMSLPWVGLVQEKIKAMLDDAADDINLYGATNHQEFFAVAGEYFFERPHLLKQKHPELYRVLAEVFKQDLAAQIDPHSYDRPKEPGRNDPCPCGSGKKYKRCCLD